MSFTGEKILVIGGSGFIGSHICKKALLNNMQVTCISLNKNLKPLDGVNYLNVNITLIDDLKEALKKKNFDYVVNCGGYIDHRFYVDGGSSVIKQHLDGVNNLINIIDFRNLKRFVQIGSSDEYGLATAPQKEETDCVPISSYSLAKLSSTKLVQMLGKYENYRTCALRLFLVYGPGQKENRLLPYVINSILKKKKLRLTAGEQIRDFTYVDDIVEGIFSSFNLDNKFNGEILNLCSSKPIKIKEIVNQVASLTKSEPLIYGDVAYRNNENMELWGSNKKAQKLLNWQPKKDLIEGLKETINSYDI